MARFDVYATPIAEDRRHTPFWLDVQADHLQGLGTRVIGPSVFLDLIAESNPAGERLSTWLTPFDVPRPALRRWSVVLTRSGQVVCS
jgi:hypothetical protein